MEVSTAAEGSSDVGAAQPAGLRAPVRAERAQRSCLPACPCDPLQSQRDATAGWARREPRKAGSAAQPPAWAVPHWGGPARSSEPGSPQFGAVRLRPPLHRCPELRASRCRHRRVPGRSWDGVLCPCSPVGGRAEGPSEPGPDPRDVGVGPRQGWGYGGPFRPNRSGTPGPPCAGGAGGPRRQLPVCGTRGGAGRGGAGGPRRIPGRGARPPPADRGRRDRALRGAAGRCGLAQYLIETLRPA